MGRRKIQISPAQLLRLRWEGKSLKAISGEVGVSIPTLSRRIAELEHQKGVISKYRELQGLQLTLLQFRILEAITPERIEKASITELLLCFYILKKAEIAISGNGSARVSGVLEYLSKQ